MEDKKEAQAVGGRRFQREGPITEKELDLAIVVLVRGSVEDEGMRQRSDSVTKLFSRCPQLEIRRFLYSMQVQIGS